MPSCQVYDTRDRKALITFVTVSDSGTPISAGNLFVSFLGMLHESCQYPDYSGPFRTPLSLVEYGARNQIFFALCRHPR